LPSQGRQLDVATDRNPSLSVEHAVDRRSGDFSRYEGFSVRMAPKL
jgi:hypothetical protein